MSEVENKPVEEVAPAPPTTEPPQEETPVAPVVEAEIPAADQAAAATSEEAKVEVKEEKKEEPPKDIREDPIGWLGQQIPPAVHKVNYMVLDWVQKLVIDEEDKRQPLPGKNEMVTKKQFINFLKDGNLLANLANKLSPGAIETVHEGEALKEKENQKANVEAFTSWAKTTLQAEEDKAMTPADLLEKGKAGYPAVFGTLWQLASQAKEKFDKDGIDIDSVVTGAGQAMKTSLIQTILGFFKRARPQTTQSAKQAAMEAEEKERAEAQAKEGANAGEQAEQVVEEVLEKVEQAAPGPAAVAAN